MIKRFATLFLALVASFGMISAEKVKIGDLYYELDIPNLTAEVTHESASGETEDPNANYSGLMTANIPSTVEYNGNTYDVISIGYYAFTRCNKLSKVTIPSSVTIIRAYAFVACTRLTIISIPNSVTSIEECAFSGCSSLSTIDLPDFLTSISTETFAACSSLSAITIPSSISTIGPGVFRGCSKMTYLISLASAVPELQGEHDWFKNVPSGIPVYVPAGSIAAYQAAEGWNYFTNIQAIPDSKHSVTTFADHGSVSGGGVYSKGTDVTLTAVPDEGFAFQMWSDGSTDNPKTFTLTKDTTFRALFYMPDVEQEVLVEEVASNSVTIKWDNVEGASLYELRIYKNAQLVAAYDVDNENNILNEILYAPERIAARRDSTGGSSEMLQVEVSGLEAGQDYTYSLDALDDSRNYVGSQSGDFTTEEETGIVETQGESRKPNLPCKEWRDGQLLILRVGKTYTLQGQEVK